MNTVYVVQDSRCVDPETGQLKAKFDFSPAEKFGRLQFLLTPNASPFNLPPVIAQLQRALTTFDDTDYLLLSGNPVLLGLACAIAADMNDGNLRLLQWSGIKKTYIPVVANEIFAE